MKSVYEHRQKRDIEDAGRFGKVNAKWVVYVAGDEVRIRRESITDVDNACIHYRIAAIPDGPKVNDDDWMLCNNGVNRRGSH